ncbi:MAG TPA: dihydroorotase, partial [Bacteroidia bacterium]|nr:dihydroorotase [Bacteroidia bacterium]
MKILVQKATITDPASSMNGKVCDILIENGTITSLKANIPPTPDMQVVTSPNLHASPGWFDMQSNFRDPGFEYKEDITSGSEAAASGGFTGVALMPSTLPPVHSKAEVEYIRNKTKGHAVDVYPIGT